MRPMSLFSRLFAAAVLCAVLPLPSAVRAQVPVETELQARIAREPGQIAPYLELARLYFEQGRLDEAERMLTSAIELIRRQRITPSWSLTPRAEAETRKILSQEPVRIGGDIREPRKIRDVRPVYPQVAQDAKIQGIVIIETVIDELGNVIDAKILRSVPMLDQAALDAVRQWMFTPTYLNGEPRKVIMTVTISFTLN